MLTGTLMDALAVVIGGTIGLLLHKNLPKNVKGILFQALGLISVIISVKMGLQAENILTLLLSLVIGAVIGEVLELEKRLDGLGAFVKRKVGSQDTRFTEGIVLAFLVFCIGPMTILGSLNDGMSNDIQLLSVKSVLDGVTAIPFAATYGLGVLFSIIPLLLFQGTLTILAAQLGGVFSEVMVKQLSATGGILIFGLALNILEIKKIRVANLLPALVIVVLLTLLLATKF